MIDTNYQICKRCIMDTSDPEISFNNNGICSHCQKFDNVILKNWFPNEEGKKKLDSIIKKIIKEGKNKSYHCLIGLSGGVDSSYLAYMLRTEYPELKILAVHVDGGWNSELAVNNIQNIINQLNIDLHTVVIPWEEMKDLQLAFFKSQLSNQDIPQDHAFFSNLYHIADKNNIKYFLSGGNYATESILPSSWGYDANDGKLLRSIYKKFGNYKLNKYRTFSFFKRRVYYPWIKKINVIRPLDLCNYNKEEAKRIVSEKIGWRDYGGKHHESKFTKFFQAYWLPEKFGFDKRRAHLSSLIVAGQLSREEALKEIMKPIYNEKELNEDKNYVAKKLGLNINEFEKIMKLPNKTHLDYKSDLKKEMFFRKIKKLIFKS